MPDAELVRRRARLVGRTRRAPDHPKVREAGHALEIAAEDVARAENADPGAPFRRMHDFLSLQWTNATEVRQPAAGQVPAREPPMPPTLKYPNMITPRGVTEPVTEGVGRRP